MYSQLHIINNIDSLTKNIKKVGLTTGLFNSNEHAINGIAEKIGLEPRQAALFAAAFRLCFDKGEVTIGVLAKYAKLDFVDMPLLIQDIRMIEKSGFLIRTSQENKASLLDNVFAICPKVRQQLLNDEKLQQQELTNLSLNEVFEQTSKLVEYNNHHLRPNSELISDFMHLLTLNSELKFIKVINRDLKDDVDKLFLCFLCHKFVSYAALVIMTDFLEELFGDRSIQHALRTKLFTGESPLLKKRFIRVNDVEEVSRQIMPTEKTRLLLETGSVQKDINVCGHDSIYHWTNINSREMFHNPEEAEEIEKIRRILVPGNFKKFTGELTSRGMSKGVSILFHGASGTGKTETVYQLARTLKRDLFVVDISKTKDKYFGESEKLIAQLFSDYAALSTGSHKPPILFFNEADAIFSTRNNILTSNVVQTENAMQNILLQEMEKLQGVLIATTNLNANFDKAFDRRFLFKVRFNKPNEKALRQIWMSKMPSLLSTEVDLLVQKFYLTGAQIDNIVRKVLIDQHAVGRKVVLDDLVHYCEQEVNYNNTKPVMGFKA